MKPHKIIFDEPDKMQVVAQIPDKTQRLTQKIRPHKGHKLFEINLATGKCKEAEYEKIEAKLLQTNPKSIYPQATVDIVKKVIHQPNCLYISSLNKKNALIKFLKMAGKQMSKK